MNAKRPMPQHFNQKFQSIRHKKITSNPSVRKNKSHPEPQEQEWHQTSPEKHHNRRPWKNASQILRENYFQAIILYLAISVSILNCHQQNLFSQFKQIRNLLTSDCLGGLWNFLVSQRMQACIPRCQVHTQRPLWELHLRRHLHYHTWHRQHSGQHDEEASLLSHTSPPDQMSLFPSFARKMDSANNYYLMLLTSELKSHRGMCHQKSLGCIPPSPNPSSKRAHSRFYLGKVRLKVWEIYQGKVIKRSWVVLKINNIYYTHQTIKNEGRINTLSDIQVSKQRTTPSTFLRNLLKEILPIQGCKPRKIKTQDLGNRHPSQMRQRESP